MAMNQVFLGATVCSCLAVFVGCSRGTGGPKHPLSGTVTQKGKPVEGAIVAFTPTGSGAPASGVTDASGFYQLTTRESGDGAVLGAYQVTIAKYDTKLPPPEEESAAEAEDPYDITNEYPAGYDEMDEAEKAAVIARNLLPGKYANAGTSGLTAEVGEGENKFDFDLD